jgi:hypothetical protein
MYTIVVLIEIKMMAANDQAGNNRIFDTHVLVDLTEMDTIVPRARSESASQWAQSRMVTTRNNMNDVINAFRASAEEMIFLHRAVGGDPNEEEEFDELYLSLAVNVGNGAGKEHPESYTQHPMGFGNGMIRSVAGVDTSDPVGRLHVQTKFEMVSERKITSTIMMRWLLLPNSNWILLRRTSSIRMLTWRWIQLMRR